MLSAAAYSWASIADHVGALEDSIASRNRVALQDLRMFD